MNIDADIPEAFHRIFARWQDLGTIVVSARWENHLQRHVLAHVRTAPTVNALAKLAMASQADRDEDTLLGSLQREVWWYRMVEAFRTAHPAFLGTAPRMLFTNVDVRPFADAVAYYVATLPQGRPLISWDPVWSQRQLVHDEYERITESLAVLVDVLGDLNSILQPGHTPELVAPPYGMRQALAENDMQRFVPSHGSFEPKNILVLPDAWFVLMNAEKAGYYPEYYDLAYLYHRLYCTMMEPTLAQVMLNRFQSQHVTPGNRAGFLARFVPRLQQLVEIGWRHDSERRKLRFWNRKQRLRQRLLSDLRRGKYSRL